MAFLESLGEARHLVREASLGKPGSRYYLYRDFFHRDRRSEFPNEMHLNATLNWLKAAQDSSCDGGVAGRYHLRTGWSSSYPETTGYLIPTFLDLATRRRDDELVNRAERMVSFLLKVQMPEGAFPGGEITGETYRPVVFNTGQIVQGLVAWHEFSGEKRALDAALRACHWLVAVQSEDGSWKKHTYVEKATTYHARAAWALAQCGLVSDTREFLDAASRHLDWVLSLADRSTGWIDFMGFYEEDHKQRRALTHTIAYTYRGLLELATLLRRDECWDVIYAANERLLRRLELKRTLAAVFNHAWKEQVDYVCLTGCAQLAGVWTRLYRRSGDLRYLNGALKALDIVKNSQVMGSCYEGINGGVAGSSPLWGDYIRFAFPNWAAKFFVDGLVSIEDCIKDLEISPPRSDWSTPAAVTRGEHLAMPDQNRQKLKVLVLSVPNSPKGYEIGAELLKQGVRPEAVILDIGLPELSSLFQNALRKLRSQGPFQFLRDLRDKVAFGRFTATSAATDGRLVEAFCAQNAIPSFCVPGINSAASRTLLSSLRPDLLILAGVGIVRQEILEVPSRGTLNAHMGLLPFFRGMNAAEWSVLNGSALGCSVHYVDSGVDTGEILAVQELRQNGIKDVDSLRSKVNQAQVQLLCKVVAAMAEGKDLRKYSQLPAEGRQFFTMHRELRNIVSRRLKKAV
jgi:Formyl transferase/Beta-L-arabinofuranosidase, GH127